MKKDTLVKIVAIIGVVGLVLGAILPAMSAF